MKQCAEKLSCVGRDLSERVTFWSQSADGQEQRFKTNIQWSTQLRFLCVAYFAKFATRACVRALVKCGLLLVVVRPGGGKLNDVLWSWRARFQMLSSNCHRVVSSFMLAQLILLLKFGLLVHFRGCHCCNQTGAKF